MRRQTGLSLVEILVALFLASLLLIILIQQYLGFKRQFIRDQAALEQVLELQLVSHLIRDSLKKAGFTPCLNLTALQTDNISRPVALTINAKHQQSLQTGRMSEHFNVVQSMRGDRQLLLAGEHQFKERDRVLISDCYHAELVQLSAVYKSSLLLNHALVFDYISPVYVGEWIEEEFFMEKNQRQKIAFYYRHKHPEELSAEISSLFIQKHKGIGQTLIQVDLGLVSSQRLRLETALRTG